MSTATEPVAAFRERAREWLAQRAPKSSAETAQEWGQGDFSVVVFHDATDEEELAVLQEYQAWHREKVAAGFGAIAVPTEFGGMGLSKGHEAAFKELEAMYEVPRDHEV